MSESKHTPGPWEVNHVKGTKSECGQLTVDQAGKLTDAICDVHGELTGLDFERPESEQLANAERIVACVNACEGLADPTAVPDLLAACQAVVAAHDAGEGVSNAMIRHLNRLARAAIDKATGGK